MWCSMVRCNNVVTVWTTVLLVIFQQPSGQIADSCVMMLPLYLCHHLNWHLLDLLDLSCHSQWSVGYSSLFSIQFCLELLPPSSPAVLGTPAVPDFWLHASSPGVPWSASFYDLVLSAVVLVWHCCLSFLTPCVQASFNSFLLSVPLTGSWSAFVRKSSRHCTVICFIHVYGIILCRCHVLISINVGLFVQCFRWFYGH